MPSGQFHSRDSTRNNFLLFEVARTQCALRVEDVTEILPMASLSCESNSTGILAGFLNVGGAAVPVLHVWRLLDAAEIPVDLHACVIIVERGQDRYGMIVSAILEIVGVSDTEVVDLPPHAVTRSAVRHARNIIPVVCIKDVVLEQERQRIGLLRETQQRRLNELQEVAA